MRTLTIAASVVAYAVVATSAHAQWSTAQLSEPRASLAATTIGDLAIFAGGEGPQGASDVGRAPPFRGRRRGRVMGQLRCYPFACRPGNVRHSRASTAWLLRSRCAPNPHLSPDP